MAKIFTFKGKTLEELEKMNLDEFSKLVTSRTRRSLKRNQNKKLDYQIEKALKVKSSGKEPKPIRTHDRDAIVIPKMVGLSFAIYNGKEFEIREIMQEMLGHYLGEMVLTRKRLLHGKAGIGATKSSTAITARK
ncbi:MAG: 30S ribosomal protein S19 [Candidatus Diapherotrites archaeon CG10_big_fil_rev_8_21_14_0_10_31_34]|nr:MAG: 30S ribosomal protein S19 [Candidatus Diapherotrites archaeon CG10_big_fil_rev_8_21_14_0_10_31_34]